MQNKSLLKNVMEMLLLLYTIGEFTLGDQMMFFSENGFNQTVPSYVDEYEVEMEILELLGLPEHRKENWTDNSTSQSAPNFLLRMYERLNPDNFYHGVQHGSRQRRFAEYQGEDKLVSPLDELELQESDNVMTLMATTSSFFDDEVFQGKLENVLWFNSSEIPCDVSLVMGQLKIYKRNRREKKKFYEIAVFTIDSINQNALGLNFVSSIQTVSTYEGWLQLNVTKALQKWLIHSGSNKGLYIVTTVLENRIKKKVNIVKTGLATLRSMGNMKPFMVGYFRNKKEVSFAKAKIEAARRKRRPHHLYADRYMKSDSRTHRNCQRQTFTVDFKKLNWLSWIVAPEKFDSFYCSGDCSFPLNNINTTNHAIIQTLAHLKNPNLPKPCCAPTALTSIVIIYHVSQDLVNMKKYNNMVVKSCGCL